MKCKNCGNNCPPRVKFCPTCGKEIQGIKRKSHNLGIVLIILLIIGGSFGICAILTPYPSNVPCLIFLVFVIIIGGLCFGAMLEDML